MLQTVTLIALILSGFSFVLFIAFAAFELWSQHRARLAAPPPGGEHEARVQKGFVSGEEAAKILASLGEAAKALKTAGPTATTAALCFAFLLVALVAAGLDLVPHGTDDKTKPATTDTSALEKKFLARFDELDAKIKELKDELKKSSDSHATDGGTKPANVDTSALEKKLMARFDELESKIKEKDEQKKGDNIGIKLDAVQANTASIATSVTNLERTISETLMRFLARPVCCESQCACCADNKPRSDSGGGNHRPVCARSRN